MKLIIVGGTAAALPYSPQIIYYTVKIVKINVPQMEGKKFFYEKKISLSFNFITMKVNFSHREKK